MKKLKNLKLVILFFIISFAGLMIIQGYYVRSMIKLQKITFDNKIHDILLEIHHSIENDTEYSNLLINIIKKYENNEKINDILLNKAIDRLNFKIDSVNDYFGVQMKYDFAIYDTENNQIVLKSYHNDLDNIDITERSLRIGWRVKAVVGARKYRVGVHFYNEFVQLLALNRNVLIVTMILMIILIWGFIYTFMNLVKQKKISAIKNDFINNMSHELKTPIFSSSVIHKLLKTKIASSEESKKLIDLLVEENNKLKTSVEKVLNIAMLEHHKIKMDFEKTDIHQLIEQTKKFFDPLISQQNVTIKTEFDKKNIFVFADPYHLKNVLFNLIDNGIKYNNKAPLIKISTIFETGYCTVSVRDNGMGIEKKHLSSIFDKFYRVPTGNQHNVKGFGLGLSYTDMIIKGHKGEIKVKSNPGKGSTFKVILPAIQG